MMQSLEPSKMDKLQIASLNNRLESSATSEGCLRKFQDWELPDFVPALGSRQVHLWVIDHQRLSPQVFTQAALVSYEERQRAGAYHFRRDRIRYLAVRSVLRDLLARYLGMKPAEVPLILEVEGKPQIAPPNLAGIFFNLTHTDRFSLIALTCQAAIGVDLEAVVPQSGNEELARHILSERELAIYDALPEHLKLDRFYMLWTMKEAVLKAFGTGFRADPRMLEVGVSLDSVQVRKIFFDGEDRGEWTLIQLPAAEGYRAALAVEGAGWSQDCWRWIGPLQR
jgi:4'-phosphopantetheinyl transferase